MNGPGKKRLTGSAFAFEKNGGIAVGNLLENPEQPLHFLILTDDILK